MLSEHESNQYHSNVYDQISNINKKKSSFQGIPLNGHQKSFTNWISSFGEVQQIQISTFIGNYFYHIHDLKDEA